MQLQDQVITLSQAKRLKELGVRQKSQFLWEWSENGQLHSLQYKGNCYPNCAVFKEDFCAFTVAELFTMLPDYYPSWRFFVGEGSEDRLWIATVITCKPDSTDSTIETVHAFDRYAKTQAEALATLLIALLETEAITVEEVNSRLCA